MPRRMITGDICRNEKVASLPDAGRFLFIGIFSNADDDGRLKASPRFLKALIFPYDEDKTSEQVKQLRDQCAALGLIRLYIENGMDYLDLPGWHEHQLIRKDRYNRSQLPSFEDSEVWQPSGNQVATNGCHSIVKSSLVKSNTPLLRKGARKKRATETDSVKKQPVCGDGELVTPNKKQPKSESLPPKEEEESKKQPSAVLEVFAEMRKTLGYSEKVRGGEALPAIEENQAMTADRRDPIPNYGKEGKAIKRMLTRGFTCEEILACWKAKVFHRGGEFISMTWVNEDIGKQEFERRDKAGGQPQRGVRPKPEQERLHPIRRIDGETGEER